MNLYAATFLLVALLSISDTTATIPTIKAVHATVVAKRGSNVTLECFGSDVRVIDTKKQWKFNGQIIKEDTNEKAKVKKHRLLPDAREKGFFRLHITNVSEEDVGEYVCMASVANHDKLDVAKDSIKLSLYNKVLNVSSTRQRITVREGRSITLECKVNFTEGDDVWIFWLFNGRPNETMRLQKVSGNKTLSNKAKEQSFSWPLKHVTHAQSGTYTCGANSTNVTSAQNISVSVHDVPGNYSEHKFTTDKPSSDPSTRTMLFIVLGLLAGLITMAVLIKFWIGRRHKPPASLRLPPDIDENDFKYDVFVTYSRKDCPWVEEELLCLLRENQVKYCVDHEHFELGKVFVQAMVDSVYQSRKVLAVWSENYASSKYCKQELDYAIQRSFQNNDCSVIVIRLDRTDRKRLPKPLRTKTFLDYSDSVERKGWEKRLIRHLKGPDHTKNATETIV